MKSKLLSVNYVLSILSFLIFFVNGFSIVNAQESEVYWQTIPKSNLINLNSRYALPEKFVAIQCNTNIIRQQLSVSPLEFTSGALNSNVTFKIPMPDGSTLSFKMVESMVMDPALALQFPTIKTFSGQGIEERDAILKVSISPNGFHAMILSPKGNVFIDPLEPGNPNDYILYFRNDFKEYRTFSCELDNLPINKNRTYSQISSGQANKTHGTQLRNYRLALACTGEYAAFYGGTIAGAMAGMVATMNRVNGIYESEVAVRMTMVANNNLLIYTNAGTDPYTNTNGSTMLGQNITNCNTVIGSANYDIGHVFSTGGGGVAYLGVPCTTNKAGGVTGSGNPVGDAFDVDYVAHEMGHQFGGSHTFNATTSSCGGGNRSASAAYEPGSGITIMAYAGICGATNDLAPNSIAYFHTHSFDQITNYITTGSGNTCPTTTATGNIPPTVTPDGLNYNIPYLTPFSLNATGSDANGDAITFSWEEYDLGAAGNWNAPVGDAPIFRPFPPTSTGTRVFPKISDIVNNTTTIGEILPSYARILKFKVTARDNRVNGGGVNRIDNNVNVNVINTGAAFTVTAPNTAITWASGASAAVTWNVSSTNIAPISCANVNILLSTDGGFTYPITLLLNTPNDGSENITVPGNVTSTARVKVEGAGNIFFDISNVNFNIIAGGGVLTTISTDPISPLTLCPGQALSVGFVGNGNANAGNVYTAQLSSSSGSFASPVNIGTLSSTASSGSVSCIIPGGSLAGTGYRIRVNSSLPSVIGNDNGSNLIMIGALGATGSISGLSTVCQGQTGVVYSTSAVLNASNYAWTLPIGFTITAGTGTNSITVSIAANASSGPISVTPSNACNTNSASSAYAVTVSPLPSAAGIVSGTTSVCQGDQNLIYSVPAIGFATSYSWSLPVGFTIIGTASNSITVNVGSGAASGVISVYGVNSCGNGISSSLNIAVSATPSAAVVSNSGLLSVCSPNTVSMSFVPSAGVVYQWRRNGLNLAGETGTSYVATQTGNYDVVSNFASVGSQQFTTNVPAPIPDNSCTGVASPIVVSGYTSSIPTSGIYVQLNLTHTYLGDLDIFLESPSGERLGLSDQTGNSGNGGDNFTNTVFADSGSSILPTTGAPYSGLYKPWNSIFTVNSCALTTTHTSFAGLGGGSLNPNGTWNLKVYDRAGIDTGRVVNWTISFPGVSGTCSSVSNVLSVDVISPITFTSFSPSSGNAGNTISLFGTQMNTVTSVLFNGVSAGFVIVSNNELSATVPVGATSGVIILVGPCNSMNSSSSFVVNTGSSNLNLYVAIEGFYMGGGNMVGVVSSTVSDTVTVQLRNTSSPYSVSYSINVPLNLNGQASIIIPPPYSGNSYYIAVKHRNSLETWSKFPVLMSPVVNYSFKN
jgi:subtilisin-like proprotein convertase family protein